MSLEATGVRIWVEGPIIFAKLEQDRMIGFPISCFRSPESIMRTSLEETFPQFNEYLLHRDSLEEELLSDFDESGLPLLYESEEN